MVATPTASHAAVIEELAGKPIFVEKPMTNDVGAARSLVERAAKRIFVMDMALPTRRRGLGGREPA